LIGQPWRGRIICPAGFQVAAIFLILNDDGRLPFRMMARP
jgi:hypothetical protein